MKKYLIIAFLFSYTIGLTQDAVTNNGNLQIHATGSIAFFGDFTNAATASLQNNGSVYAKRSLTNNQSSMAAGSGTLFLNGSTSQNINGSQPLQTYHLTTDNTAGIILNTNLHVSGVHTFSSGIITTSSTPNYLVYEASASTTGAANTAHVNGWIKKSGTTDFIFPTGNGVYFREIEIKNLSTSSEFDARYSGPSGNLYNLQYPIASINPNEHWTLNKISGGTAQVKLNWDNSKVGFPDFVVNDIRTAWYSGAKWMNTGGTATGTAATNGNITSDAVSNFGKFVIASVSYPVPLQFMGIGARRENSSAKITWQTGNEVNVNFYEVQRSMDGFNFVTVGTVPAKNSDAQFYNYLDLNVPVVKLFYRIKANDVDASIRYSKIVTVSELSQNQKIELIQNPVHSAVLLATSNIPVSIFSYRLINSEGQLCKKGSFKCEGTSTVSIPVSLVTGSYTLIIFNSNTQQEFKLIVQ